MFNNSIHLHFTILIKVFRQRMAFRTSKSAKKSKPTPPPKQGNTKKSAEKRTQQIDSAAQKKKEKAKKIAKSEVITLAVMNRARLDDLGHENQIQDLLDNLKTGFRAVGCNPNDFQKDQKFNFTHKIISLFQNHAYANDAALPSVDKFQKYKNYEVTGLILDFSDLYGLFQCNDEVHSNAWLQNWATKMPLF